MFDTSMQRYPEESCAALEDVRISWSPHLHQVESLLLKIRKAGVDGQVTSKLGDGQRDGSGAFHRDSKKPEHFRRRLGGKI